MSVSPAERLLRHVLSLAEPRMRAAVLAEAMRGVDAAELATCLDELASFAERGESRAKEFLIAFALAAQDGALAAPLRALEAHANANSLWPLERLLRRTWRGQALEPHATVERREKVPDYGAGRSLTLGERKSLARRPNRAQLDKLFADPNPEVIRRLLENPRVTEDDVVRLASRRPIEAATLVQVARSEKWSSRPRVRMALLLNPRFPEERAAPLVALLMRHELQRLAEFTQVPASVRALALEHYARRAPRGPTGGEGIH